MFDTIQDDTRQTKIKDFGELVVVYTHVSLHEIKILMFALKYTTMPKIVDLEQHTSMNLDDFRADQNQFITSEYKYWINRVKRYSPRFARWTIRHNLKVSNYALLEHGIIPNIDHTIKMPTKPIYKLKYFNFIKNNINLVLKYVFNIISIPFAPHRSTRRLDNANTIFTQIIALYQQRSTMASTYFILSAVYTGCILSAIILTFLSKLF